MQKAEVCVNTWSKGIFTLCLVCIVLKHHIRGIKLIKQCIQKAKSINAPSLKCVCFVLPFLVSTALFPPICFVICFLTLQLGLPTHPLDEPIYSAPPPPDVSKAAVDCTQSGPAIKAAPTTSESLERWKPPKTHHHGAPTPPPHSCSCSLLSW